MPFQDVDEIDETTAPPAPPSRLDKLLRRIFIEDWSLKLLSLAIALVLWLLVTGQNQPVTAHVNVQLNFIRPPSLEISNDPPRSVDVMLTGSRNKLDDLTTLDLVATVDISDQRAGERVLRLADKAQISLPQGVKVDGFQPSAIPVRLEPIVERQVPVEPKLEGQAANGYEVYGARPNKGSVTLRGPESRVAALQKVRTETISLGGHKDSFLATNVAIDVPDPKVDLIDPVVNVEVDIGERRVEKSVSGVAVTAADGSRVQPASASVTVLGPSSMVDSLKTEDLKVIVDGNGPKLQLPPALNGKVIMKSIQPGSFLIVK
ncbi:MAG TPA: CdaR family protein [Pyrinomonadaceae bacterium]|nr:CdaR family protein [Pyrinomonadaceae bacterium]